MSLLVWVVTLFVAAAGAAQGNPITVDLHLRLDRICDEPVFDEANCIPDDTPVDLSVTYDPDTLVPSDGPFGSSQLTTDGPLDYTFSISPLEIPWGGPISRSASASLTALGAAQELRIQILDQSFAPGPDFGFWQTRFIFQAIVAAPTPGADPVAADFESALRNSDVFPSTRFTAFQTFLVTDNSYAPGSRSYISERVPAPPVGALLISGFGALGLRRVRRGRSLRARDDSRTR